MCSILYSGFQLNVSALLFSNPFLVDDLIVEFSHYFRIVKLLTIKFLYYYKVCNILIVSINYYFILTSQKVVLVLFKA